MSIIFGFHAVTSYLNNSVNDICNIYMDSARHDQRVNNLIDLCKTNNIDIILVDSKKLDSLAKGGKHQGIVAELSKNITRTYHLKELLNNTIAKDDSIILILDGITDPHNLGAIIRTAECFGVDGIILPKDNSANVSNSTVAKISSGAINNIPVITVTNINRTIDELKEQEYWITGTTLASRAVSLFDFNFTGKVAIVMGNEEKGIRKLVQENCDFLVTIPRYGKTQSLNVSVASGIILSYVRLLQHK